MNGTHPSELERLKIAAQSLVIPGTFQEEAALERIEQLRRDELAELSDTFEARQRRRRRHFKSGRSL